MKLRFALVLLSSFLCGAASGAEDKTPPEAQAEASLEFAIDVFQKVASTAEADENVVFSPFGFYQTLEALSLATAGETKAEIDAAMKQTGVGEDWTARMASVIEKLNADPEVSVAGGVWVNKGFKLKKSYIDSLAHFTDQEALELDFSDPESPAVINDWFEQKTNGNIKDLIDSFGPHEIFVIGGAVHFLGEWEHTFDPNATYEGEFEALDGERYSTPMMALNEHFAYRHSDGVHYLELDYRDRRYSMAIVFPDKAQGYLDLEKSLNAEKLTAWKNDARMTDVMLHMPKFAFEQKVDLIPLMREMGVETAFSIGADFSRMTSTTMVFISRAFQQATLKVNESGTEAAAGTAAVGAMGMPSYIFFPLNRPFIYFIRENSTGEILFIGRVVKPKVDPDDPDMKAQIVEE